MTIKKPFYTLPLLLTSALGCSVVLTVSASEESANKGSFALTLNEVAALIDQGDEESLAEAHTLIQALREKVDEDGEPRVEAYAARILLTEERYDEALELVDPYIADREAIDPRRQDCYFTAALIHQAMAYIESPDTNRSDGRVSFMGLDIGIERPEDDEPALIGEGLGHAMESLNLLGFIASHTPPPMRLDALEQAGQTLIIMHEWEQARQAYRMALEQTTKADAEQLSDEERETRIKRYKKRLEELEAP